MAQHYGDEAAGTRLQVQPLTDIHLSPEVAGGLTPASNPTYSYVLAGIALLVLLIACINFMILSLGRSAGRALEVGIRKAAGAQRGQLRGQFFGEAILTSTLALIVGVVLAMLLLPAFNELSGRELSLDLFGSVKTWLALIGIVLLAGLVAGGYPAIVLSRFEPATALRGRSTLGSRNWFTRSLMVGQFALSIVFITGLLIMTQQLDFMKSADLGFNEEQVILIRTSSTMEGERIYEPFKNRISRYAAVQSVTGSFFGFGSSGMPLTLQLDDGSEIKAFKNPVDVNFLETMQIDLLRGRDFSATGTRNAVLVNETLAHVLGEQFALGETLPAEGDVGERPVIGVVEDFHFRSLRHETQPLVLVPHEAVGGGVMAIAARIRPGNLSQTLSLLEETWHQVASGVPFGYAFLDEVVDQQYREAERWRTIVGYAAILALLIACSGLFGMAALTAQQRTKEIGIRKVLGASVPSIVMLLSKDFLKLVAVAFVIAVPLAYWAMSRWLQNFAYHIDLGPWIFLGAGVLALVIALATDSYQAIRAALADPVDALRYE